MSSLSVSLILASAAFKSLGDDESPAPKALLPSAANARSLSESTTRICGPPPPAANGEAPTANGEAPTANGEAPTANGEAPTANGEAPTANGWTDIGATDSDWMVGATAMGCTAKDCIAIGCTAIDWTAIGCTA